MEIYDENKAVKAINAALLHAGRNSYEDDELLNVIDMIWDYYEENGMLEIDDDFEADDDEDVATDLRDYILRMLKKDKESTISLSDVELIVNAELDYEDSILE